MLRRFAGLRGLLSRQFASAFVSRFASSILGFATLLVASRLLTTYEYGVYVFLFSVGSALGAAAVLGQQNLVLKHYRPGEGAGAGNADLVRYNLGWLTLALALLLVVGIGLRLAAPALPDPYDRLHLACAFAAVFAVSEYLQSYFRIQGSIWLALLPREVVWRGASALMFCVASLFGILYGATEAMEIVLALFIAVTGYQIVRLADRHGSSFRRRGVRADARNPASLVWRKESLLFWASNTLYALVLYIETVIIGAVVGMEAAAFYFVALRYATLLTLPGAAIDTVTMPLIAARFQASDRAGAQRLISLHALGSFLISSAGAVAMILVGPFALALFKPDFAAHTDVLLVLCLSTVVGTFFGPSGGLLMLRGGERYYLVSSAILYGAYAVVLCGLATIWGILGVAVANLIVTLCTNLNLARWVRARCGLDSTVAGYFRPLGAPTHAAG